MKYLGYVFRFVGIMGITFIGCMVLGILAIPYCEDKLSVMVVFITSAAVGFIVGCFYIKKEVEND